MINNIVTLGTDDFTKKSVNGSESQFNVVLSPRKTLRVSTEVTKAGVQRTLVQLAHDTPTTRFSSNGDSVTGRSPVSVSFTLSFPKSQDDSAAIDDLIDLMKLALADGTLVAAVKNGEA